MTLLRYLLAIPFALAQLPLIGAAGLLVLPVHAMAWVADILTGAPDSLPRSTRSRSLLVQAILRTPPGSGARVAAACLHIPYAWAVAIARTLALCGWRRPPAGLWRDALTLTPERMAEVQEEARRRAALWDECLNLSRTEVTRA